MRKDSLRRTDEKLFRIILLSHTGDKVHVKLPKEFVRRLIKNNAIDIFKEYNDIIDNQKLLKLAIDALEHNLSGEIARIERNNGDIVKIIID